LAPAVLRSADVEKLPCVSAMAVKPPERFRCFLLVVKRRSLGLQARAFLRDRTVARTGVVAEGLRGPPRLPFLLFPFALVRLCDRRLGSPPHGNGAFAGEELLLHDEVAVVGFVLPAHIEEGGVEGDTVRRCGAVLRRAPRLQPRRSGPEQR
jgi:hypothetical protein